MTSGKSAALELDALIRALAVNRGKPVSMLLGAGTSISSGMPSADRCIWEWKQDIFSTKNPALRESVGELSLSGTKRRIQEWLDRRGSYPPLADPKEYSFYAQACFPTATDRRSYFQQYVNQAEPFLGYQLLPLLVRNGIVRSVWTTNFDGLPGRACAASNVPFFEIGMDTPHRTVLVPPQGTARLVSMHGDYRYDLLKNTSEELQSQEDALREELVNDLRDHDLVVIGYSGRDESLMNALSEAYSTGRAGRLYWCGMQDKPSNEVQALLTGASAVGRDTFYVHCYGFDDLMERIALRLLDGPELDVAKQLLTVLRADEGPQGTFESGIGPASSLVKSNAYPLTTPTEALKVPLAYPLGVKRREWLNEQMKGVNGAWVVVPTGALMTTSATDAHQRLKSFMTGAPVSITFAGDEIAQQTSVQSLFGRGLVDAVARSCLLNRESSRVWEPKSHETRPFDGEHFAIHRALSIRVETIKGKLCAVLTPEIVARTKEGEAANADATKVLRNAIYGYQHNDVYDQDLKRWTVRITGVEIPSVKGQSFAIGKNPLYAGLHQVNRPTLDVKFQHHVSISGFVVEDAKLVFSSLSGKGEVKDANPLHGLANNRPWDYSVTSSGVSTNAEVAVICSSANERSLEKFLCQLNERSEPDRTELDYLQPFPGFSAAFSLSLVHARPGEALWHTCDVSPNGSPMDGAKQIARAICVSLSRLRALAPGAITVIYVPASWAPFENVEESGERFNLHHSVKAYAAKNGQSTQFIREKTVLPRSTCRVKWWLSLALYAKAMRTPWRLDCMDDDSAFVGIGYSIDELAPSSHQILLGCSHIYSARGEGLQFRLGRIEHPIIRGRNPYMSLDDARRTGETIRQLFFDARMRLPKRVVIHKRTHFTQEEQQGLAQGLDGVANVELIEINTEESIRFLASKPQGDRLVIDGFPMPRGAVVVLGVNEALLWVHGHAPSVQNTRFKYYQGKRRIPAPLLIKRFRGNSDLELIAREILGLSKMNWNHFDYYSRLPASLESASAIARVGEYLSHYGNAPYDYRLLI